MVRSLCVFLGCVALQASAFAHDESALLQTQLSTDEPPQEDRALNKQSSERSESDADADALADATGPLFGCQELHTQWEMNLKKFVQGTWYSQLQLAQDYQPAADLNCNRIDFKEVTVLNADAHRNGYSYIAEFKSRTEEMSGNTRQTFCLKPDDGQVEKMILDSCHSKFGGEHFWVVEHNTDMGYAIVASGQPTKHTNPEKMRSKCLYRGNRENVWILTTSQYPDEHVVRHARDVAWNRGLDTTHLLPVRHQNCHLAEALEHPTEPPAAEVGDDVKFGVKTHFPNGKSCNCLPWNEVYTSRGITCGQGFELFNRDANFGRGGPRGAEQKTVADAAVCENFYHKQTHNVCMNAHPGKMDVSHSWCYVDWECETSLFGGARLNELTGWRFCNDNDAKFAAFKPTELYDFAVAHGVDFGQLAKFAYPTFRVYSKHVKDNEQWNPINIVWDQVKGAYAEDPSNFMNQGWHGTPVEDSILLKVKDLQKSKLLAIVDTNALQTSPMKLVQGEHVCSIDVNPMAGSYLDCSWTSMKIASGEGAKKSLKENMLETVHALSFGLVGDGDGIQEAAKAVLLDDSVNASMPFSAYAGRLPVLINGGPGGSKPA